MLAASEQREGGAAAQAAPRASPAVRGPSRPTELARTARGLAARLLRPPVKLEDEYLDWLMLANAGMQVPGNLHLFDLAIAAAPRGPMLEIGSFCGLSTNIISYLKAKHGRNEPLFSCDRWDFEGAEKPLPAAAPATREQLREFVIASFEHAVRTFSPGALPFALEVSSDQFFALWRAGREARDRFGREVRLGGELGFAFIDGNHTYEFAMRDFVNCDEHLLPGGFLMFDDSDDAGSWEVRQVIRDVKRTGRYQVVAKNPNYLLRKLPASPAPPWPVVED